MFLSKVKTGIAKQLEDRNPFYRDDKKNKNIEEELEKYDMLRMTVADINGISRGKTVPKRHALKALQDGIGAFGGMYTLVILIKNIKHSHA